jgi:hypothetical protein
MTGLEQCQRKRRNQGDPIGRIFASWAIVYFVQIFISHKCVEKILGYFSQEKLCINFDKKGLGYILGDFFHKIIWSP